MQTSTLTAPAKASPKPKPAALHDLQTRIGNHGFAVVKTFVEAKKEIAAWTQIKQDANNELEAIFGDKLQKGAQGLYRNVVAVRVMGSSNRSVDLKALEQAFPEAYAATVKVTPYTYFK